MCLYSSFAVVTALKRLQVCMLVRLSFVPHHLVISFHIQYKLYIYIYIYILEKQPIIANVNYDGECTHQLHTAVGICGVCQYPKQVH